MATVYDVAGRRAASSLAKGSTNLYAAARQTPGVNAWHSVNGTGGELAAARALGLYWPGSVDAGHAADIGVNGQVRTREEGAHMDLCVRPTDPPEHVYVLVIGTLPDYEVVGWIRGTDATRDEWAGQSGGRPVWYVPRHALHDINGPTP